MRPLAVTAVFLLAAYIPGRAIARRIRIPSRLSPCGELTLGLCLLSWIGLVLADAGVFSATRLIVLLIVTAALVTVAAPRMSGTPAPDPRARRTAAAGAAIALAVGLLYWPPYETMVMASDATVNTTAGLHLARSGSLTVSDGLLGDLAAGERAALFPLDDAGRWVRLHELALSGNGGHLWPGFAQVLPIWTAELSGLGGLAVRGLPVVVCTALALWAICLLAFELRGAVVAAITTVLLLSNAAELFYGRFAMPEVMTQFFLWSSLLAYAVWRRDGASGAAALAGLALGIAALTRVELLFFLPLAIALYAGFPANHPTGTRVFVAAFAAPTLYGLVRLCFVPSHYRDIVWAEIAKVTSGSLRDVDTLAILRDVVLVAAVAAIALVVVRARGSARLRLRRAVVLGAAGLGLGAFVYRSDPHMCPPTVLWLAESVSWPVLALAVVGLALAVRRRDVGLGFPLLLLAVVGGTVLYDPHVGRNHLWGIRRLLPLVIPFVYLLAASALQAGARLVPARVRLLVLAAVVAALVVRNGRAVAGLRSLALFPDQERPLQALADMMPAPAVAFFTPVLEEYMIHLPLWLVYGRESAMLPVWSWRTGLETAAPPLTAHRPVFLVTEDRPVPTARGLTLTPRGTVAFDFRTPQSDAERISMDPHDLTVRLRVYEVSRTE